MTLPAVLDADGLDALADPSHPSAFRALPHFGRSKAGYSAVRKLSSRQRRPGSRFRAGLVLYYGTHQLSFGRALSCLPISASWTANQT